MSTAPTKTARTAVVVNVQALRAIAALIVVAHHMALPQFGVDNLYGSTSRFLSAFVSFGQFGVDLFFVISGFIMVATTWRFMGTKNAGPLFFLRRVIRIYPPYWLALLPVLLAHAYFSHQGMHVLGGAQDSKTNLGATLLLLPHPANEFLALPPAWTLVFEISFYIVFAFLLGLHQRFMLSALIIWGAADILMSFIFAGSSNFLLAFLATPLPLEFIAGAFIGLLYVHNKMPLARLAGLAAIVSVSALWIAEVALGDVAYAHFSVSPELENAFSTYHNTLGRVILAGIPAFLAVYSAVALEARRALIAPNWLVEIGNASYALYLWNLTIIVAARQAIIRLHLRGDGAHLLAIVVCLGSIIAVSVAVYWFFERPVTNWLHRLLTNRFRSVSTKPVGAV